MKKLTAAHLVDSFSAIVTGDDIKRGKPAPDIFLAAAEKLNVLSRSVLSLKIRKTASAPPIMQICL